ncbi:MAG: hypothetical protein KGL64_11020 [Acidobacteriota bacterium]|nr:hypothetical protein [Acidobacteriota bacterium]
MLTLGFAQQGSQEENNPKFVPYCEVVSHVEKYDHRVLETEAIYRRGGEIMSFYSPSCPTKSNASWVDYSSEMRRKSSPQLVHKMDELLDSHGRATVVALVEFDGPKPVEIPPGTAPALADIIRQMNSRYGHDNLFAYRVKILKITKVEPVSESAPWPQ